jgi:cytoskeleton protein RodZ
MSEAAQALGQRLRTEREKRGMSAQKMADDMHLDAWVIDALVAGDYERIGPAVYAQGHLRKYANILGVSAAQEVPVPQIKPAGPPAPTPIIRLDPPGGGGSIWPTVGGFAAVALVAGGIVWWRPWHTDAETTGETANEEAAAGAGEAAGSGEITPAAAATPAGPVELTPGVGRAQLRLSFSADSRVSVYDYTGKPVFTGNGRANSVKTLSGMAPFRVYLGFASGVQLQVNDRAVAIGPQFVSGDVARFEAGADGVLRRDPHPMPVGAPVPASLTPAAPTPAGPRG